MSPDAALEKILTSYQTYYTINREHPMEPFAAEAEFRLHDEVYFLIKQAKWAEQDSFEYVFFAVMPELDEAAAESLSDLAWKECLRRANPKPNHRNTDVQLVILCSHMTEGARKKIRRTNPYKSYRFGLWGWSTMKWIAYETEEGKTACNRRGESLRDLLRDM